MKNGMRREEHDMTTETLTKINDVFSRVVLFKVSV